MEVNQSCCEGIAARERNLFEREGGGSEIGGSCVAGLCQAAIDAQPVKHKSDPCWHGSVLLVGFSIKTDKRRRT